jgi:hypothetical protein
MLPWSDNSTQGKVVKQLPLITFGIVIIAAIALFYLWA